MGSTSLTSDNSTRYGERDYMWSWQRIAVIIGLTMFMMSAWSFLEVSPAFAQRGKGSVGSGGRSMSSGKSMNMGRSMTAGRGLSTAGKSINSSTMKHAPRVSTGVDNHGHSANAKVRYPNYHYHNYRHQHYPKSYVGSYRYIKSHHYPYYPRYGYGGHGTSLYVSLGYPYSYYGTYYPRTASLYYSGDTYLSAAPLSGITVVNPNVDPAAPAATAPAPAALPATVVPVAENAAEFQQQAERAFRLERFEESAKLTGHALIEDGNNGHLHLFASQVFFALGDYRRAADAIHHAATLLNPEERGFVVENFKVLYQGNEYVKQMSKLESYIKNNPDAADALFLHGYHFLFLGHKAAAKQDFEKTLELQPDDALAREFLIQAGGDVPAPVPQELPPIQPQPPKTDQLNLIGNKSDK